MADNRPIHEIRLGLVKAAIWQRSTDLGFRYNLTITRIYRKDDTWESTSSFGRDDLPLVTKVADLAHTWIFQQETQDRAKASEKVA